ncbi:MAG: hydantoinase B/oxoprolinase family protein [Gammaproteobacteria bacterium]|nr:hydantoinase B/oxoprolinase family protein [Gammaproteobacteria bacterium]MBV9697089.1 hydantoinase B/oxoprolinase family protein [Gammaproteobacteria bacterium]
MQTLRHDAAVRDWQFWIDRGGTFTDVIGLDPAGALHVRKVPSAGVGAADPGLAAAAALLAECGGGRIGLVKVGTTVATNALLTRSGEPVLLLTTAGFGDVLRIGYQNRPDIFARHIVRPAPLFNAVLEVAERLDAGGAVLEVPDATALRSALAEARGRGQRSLAIVFLHGWQHPAHEALAAQCARELGFEEVSVSHEISPLVRFVARADGTVLNAYLAPPLRRYVEALRAQLHQLDAQAGLAFMQSSGGLAAPRHFHALSSVLSGPAGGLIGMRWLGRRLGHERLIGFDMGGTSTDVALIDRQLPQRFEHQLAGVRLTQPMLDVHSIAAGGGSLLQLRDGRLAVGPASAGAIPGPACYGRGGPLTLTDAQVLLGHLRADTLPSLFGPTGSERIDRAAVERQFAALAAHCGTSSEALAVSFLEVGVEAMANAIRHVSTGRGLDAGEFVLCAFGGAAGQHACRVAQAAGMRRIIVHPLASVLSAFGIGVADHLAVRRASLRRALTGEGLAAAAERLTQLEQAARAELTSSPGTAHVEVQRFLELRAGLSEVSLSVPFGTLQEVQARFGAQHQQRFGFAAASAPVLIEALRIEARRAALDEERLRLPAAAVLPGLPARVRAWFDGWREVPLLQLGALHAPVSGPALIVEPHSTLVLEAGWRAVSDPAGGLLLEAEADAAAPGLASAEAGRLEIFNNLFMHVAEQMGEVLRATAQSVNIRERLDYSCALFDAQGALIANAPHMPVHLGSMGASVRALRAAQPRLEPGSAWLLNSPYHGGTHLPDMTVITPVFTGGATAPDFFVAARAHHADIGGVTPGSMPPFSTHIDEEGVRFDCFALVRNGQLCAEELHAALTSGPWPARRPEQNVADLRAQLAANARGIAELERAVGRHGLARVQHYMRAVQENATQCMRRALARLHSGSFRYALDSGEVICVRIEVDPAAQRAVVDFTGSAAQGAHNFNAPRAVCLAAVLYVFRTLIEEPIPLNEGCLAPLEVRIPPGSLLDPRPPAAVAAGNVETSQCIVDALFGALGMLAASQGTMNNLTFGDERLQYYETVCGGAGAGPDFPGCDAVQTHMTNSRLTDPEILEAQYPVLVREFSIRRGSGGAGRERGGDGARRCLQFRAALSGALLANHRRVAPFGLDGGAAGAPGLAWIRRASGAEEPLGATARFEVGPGDELWLLTPGGGGFGAG